MADALRRRQQGGKAHATAPDAATTKAAESEEAPAFNPLSLRAVGAVFKRRWAAPLTVAVVCLALHFTGLLDDPNQEAASPSSSADFMHRLRLPLHYAKYGLGFGALFGSGMWVLVVSLSDSAEGKPDEGVSEHWAHNNGLLLMVLLGLGTATGGVLGFVAAALLDVVQHGLTPEGLPPQS
mmetsp:Transcript_1267/g.2997  ORF Transcript_1267/g.2997 Transcript_1267/m.2997 type:complete len:181 (-) Transcript_1267:67-609(-)